MERVNVAWDLESDSLAGAARDPDAARWVRRAVWLVGGTLAYNVVEACVALWAGAEAESIALLGFGLDSIIEVAAGAVLLWRLRVEMRGEAGASVERAERRAERFVGFTFFGLALYVSADAALMLFGREVPDASPVGIGLAVASLIIMPAIAWAKLRTADRLGSAALRAEGKETLACSWLSLALLVGLVANAALGWWWADPVAALAMVPWLVREGREALEG